MVSLYQKQAKTNNAGHATNQIGGLEQLERFLILGTIGGTFYVNEIKHTEDNLRRISAIIEEFGIQAVDKIVEVGVSNRSPKHDHVLVAYAIACSTKNEKTRLYALTKFNQIVRIGTHLFHFLGYIKGRRGWGSSLKRAVGGWYNKSPEQLAYQLVKYRQRDGWSHADVLRLAHPQPLNPTQNMLFRYAESGELLSDDSNAAEYIEAAIRATESDNLDEVVSLIVKYGLPREVINTKFLKEPRVWEAMLPTLGYTAILRNLRNMANYGLLTQGSDAVREVRLILLDEERIRRGRIHPAHIWLAKTNATGVPRPIEDALEDAFYTSFKNVVPTNKRIMLALDVSGSMGFTPANGGPTAREWVALQAMVTARSEPYAEFYAFSTRFSRLNISSHDSMSDVINKTSGLPFGGTDCSLPMYVARKNGMKFDSFCIYTDNETWSGGNGYFRATEKTSGDPMKELRLYRQASGIDSSMVVTAITATDFSIADPNDPKTLDVVGMDADAPAVIADFIREA